MKISVFVLALVLAVGIEAASVPDGAKIDQLTGLKGKLNEKEGVYKVTQPRNDIKVTVDGLQMPAFMGLTSWAAFVSGKSKEAMVMGDLVLMQDEVNPVMSAALESGLEVTALHNHFFYDEPKVYFMHIGGEGSVEELAKGVKAAFDRVKEIRSTSPILAKGFGGPQVQPGKIDANALDGLLGVKGDSNNGMYKAVFGRVAKMPCGCDAGKEMGVNTWAAFMGSDEAAIVDGDFVVKENELQEVLKSLRQSGINIVAIHHHMAEENPRYLFLHYWGKGKASELARSVKTALGKTQG